MIDLRVIDAVGVGGCDGVVVGNDQLLRNSTGNLVGLGVCDDFLKKNGDFDKGVVGGWSVELGDLSS